MAENDKDFLVPMDNPEEHIVLVPVDEQGKDRVRWCVDNIEKFCVLPWINLHTTPSGDIKLCCNIQWNSFVTKQDEQPFNLGRDDIDTIWNSGNMNYNRQMHRTGLGLPACEECYIQERNTGHSPRIGQNSEWLQRQERDPAIEKALLPTASTMKFHNFGLPISLELRLGNNCNFQCISCWGVSSNLVDKERRNLIETKQVNEIEHEYIHKTWKHELDTVDSSNLKDWFETETYYNNFKKMAPNLRRLYTTGGEPTLIKSNYKMMQMLLDADNTECSFEYTSNMSTWNPEFYNRLEKFKNVEIQMSLDGVGEIAEYIRYGTDWKVVSENINKAFELASDRPGWKIKVYSVLQAFNYRHLVPLWEFLREVSDKHNKKCDWWPISIYSPEYLGLTSIAKEQRMDYADKLQEEFEKFNANLDSAFRVGQLTVDTYSNSIRNPEYNPFHAEYLKVYTDILDKSRNLNGKELFHEELNSWKE